MVDQNNDDYKICLTAGHERLILSIPPNESMKDLYQRVENHLTKTLVFYAYARAYHITMPMAVVTRGVRGRLQRPPAPGALQPGAGSSGGRRRRRPGGQATHLVVGGGPLCLQTDGWQRPKQPRRCQVPRLLRLCRAHSHCALAPRSGGVPWPHTRIFGRQAAA